MSGVHWVWWVIGFTYVIGLVIFGWVDRKHTTKSEVIARLACFLASPVTVYPAVLMIFDDWIRLRKGEKRFGRLK